MLELLVARGVPVVLGSDAHEPSLVGDRFDELVVLLRGAGAEARPTFRRPERTAPGRT